MRRILAGISPEDVLKYFEEISAIPRGSGNESGIADYLVSFAESHGLDCRRDGENNVLIRKAAQNAGTSAPWVMLQGHTDMVCEKNEGVEHDFMTDGIKLVLDGDTLSADGTTLGGDDGVAVAIMLALLDDQIASLPNLECLFTTGEEVGLDGMQAFDTSDVKSRMLINIDSEAEGIVTVACAGGVRTDFALSVTREGNSADAVEVLVSGLAGGHSGADIDQFRANANKLAARLADAARRTGDFRIIDITGGSKDNAIPRECKFSFVSADCDAVKAAIVKEAETVKAELAPADAGFGVTFRECTPDRLPMTKASTDAAVNLIRALPYGIIGMSRGVRGLVETSSNIGVVTTDGEAVHITSSSRSSVDTKLDSVMNDLEAIASMAGASVSHRARYPGWDQANGSALQDIYAEVYKATTGRDAKMVGIHAGLECGIIKGRVPEMDIISIGPELHAIHSPDESLSISSLGRTYDLIKAILAHIAVM